MPLLPLNIKQRLEVKKQYAPDAARFAADTLKRRWLSAEPMIMRDPMAAYTYAYRILKQRWPEAEPYILKDLNSAILYAYLTVKDRWPELEERLKGSTFKHKNNYYKFMQALAYVPPFIIN